MNPISSDVICKYLDPLIREVFPTINSTREGETVMAKRRVNLGSSTTATQNGKDSGRNGDTDG